MPFWVIITEGERAELSPPIGTERVISRVPLEDGLTRWFVQGGEFMEVLPTSVLGVVSAKRAMDVAK